MFSCSVMSSTVWPHGLQHARPPFPSPSPGACSNSCPLSRWCHPAISSSVIPFSSCLQSFPASGSFLMSQLFASGDESIGASASASVLPMGIQDQFPLGWTGWISLQSQGLSSLLQHHSSKVSILLPLPLSGELNSRLIFRKPIPTVHNSARKTVSDQSTICRMHEWASTYSIPTMWQELIILCTCCFIYLQENL